jgi:hypothetical protein
LSNFKIAANRVRRLFPVLVLGLISAVANAQNPPGEACTVSPPLVDCKAAILAQTCDVLHDERDCSKCLMSIGGSCQARIPDPACEAAKVAQNSMYMQKKSQCELDKAARYKACEATNAVLSSAASLCSDKPPPQ